MNHIFPSTLVIGKSTEIINEILSSLGHKKILNNPDINLIDNEYTIEKIRDIKKFLSTKPYSHQNKITIILNADNLEIPAQNALLKILEDPGENNYLILTTNKPYSLLATINSRCHHIKIRSSGVKQTNEKIIFPTGKISEQNLTKDEILPLLQDQLDLHHQYLLTHPENAKNIKTLLKSIDMINHNVDPFLALDYFLLS